MSYTDHQCYPTKALRAAIDDAANRTDTRAALELTGKYFRECGYGTAYRCWLDDKDRHTVIETIKPAIYFATGGWSGCEEVITWLDSHFIVRACWVSSQRGGAHVYELREFK